METDGREVALSHLEDIVGVGQKYVASLAIGGHKLVFALFEGFERGVVVALNPACFVEGDWLPATLCAIFMQQAILYHLKLQLPYGAYNLAAIELVCK